MVLVKRGKGTGKRQQQPHPLPIGGHKQSGHTKIKLIGIVT